MPLLIPICIVNVQWLPLSSCCVATVVTSSALFERPSSWQQCSGSGFVARAFCYIRLLTHTCSVFRADSPGSTGRQRQEGLLGACASVTLAQPSCRPAAGADPFRPALFLAQTGSALLRNAASMCAVCPLGGGPSYCRTDQGSLSALPS